MAGFCYTYINSVVVDYLDGLDDQMPRCVEWLAGCVNISKPTSGLDHVHVWILWLHNIIDHLTNHPKSNPTKPTKPTKPSQRSENMPFVNGKRYKQTRRENPPARSKPSLLEKAKRKFGTLSMPSKPSKSSGPSQPAKSSNHVHKQTEARLPDHDQHDHDHDAHHADHDQHGQRKRRCGDQPGQPDQVLVPTKLLKTIIRLIGFGSISTDELELQRLKVLQDIECLVQ
jgi:hypothetical protein